MKNVYWFLIVITLTVVIAEGYALYNIPKSETLKGELRYDYAIEILPGSTFKLSLESRAQGERKFAILAASENNDFSNFPQVFSLPVLSNSLSDIGIYQIRVQVFNNQKVLYVNKRLIPLTRADLSKALIIDMKRPPKTRRQTIITPEPIELPITIEKEIMIPEPMKLDVKGLLANKQWVLQTKKATKANLSFDMEKGYVFGSGGCNNFQGGYQVEQSKIKFNQFIASSAYCDGLMETETYFLESLPKVTNWQVKNEGKVLYFYDVNQKLLLQFNAK